MAPPRKSPFKVSMTFKYKGGEKNLLIDDIKEGDAGKSVYTLANIYGVKIKITDEMPNGNGTTVNTITRTGKEAEAELTAFLIGEEPSKELTEEERQKDNITTIIPNGAHNQHARQT